MGIFDHTGELVGELGLLLLLITGGEGRGGEGRGGRQTVFCIATSDKQNLIQ